MTIKEKTARVWRDDYYYEDVNYLELREIMYPGGFRLRQPRLRADIHRTKDPAIELPYGSVYYYHEGFQHSYDDGPATLLTQHDMQWTHGLHAPDEIPEVQYTYWDWHRHGLLHRIQGPARIYTSGRKDWFVNGQLHREDGPAIEHEYIRADPVNGRRYGWVVRGQFINEEVETEMDSGNLSEWPRWTKRDYIYFKLKFC